MPNYCVSLCYSRDRYMCGILLRLRCSSVGSRRYVFNELRHCSRNGKAAKMGDVVVYVHDQTKLSSNCGAGSNRHNRVQGNCTTDPAEDPNVNLIELHSMEPYCEACSVDSISGRAGACVVEVMEDFLEARSCRNSSSVLGNAPCG